MAEWPELDELKQLLDVSEDASDASPWDGDDDGTRLTRLLATAISQTKVDIGHWDEMDDPTDAQAEGALRLAVLLAQRPGAPVTTLTQDATYKACLKGSRTVFGIA